MKGSRMQVFIAGATGQVGRIAVEKAIDAGHAVTGMVRREEDRDDLEAIGAKTYMADVTEPESLDRAIAGHDAVVFAVGSQGEAVEKVDRDGAINLCDATKRAGIGRFVVLSSMGAGHPEDAEQIQEYMHAKHEADEYVMKSGLDWTILRPGSLKDEQAKGQIRTKERFDREGDEGLEISRADVAGVIVHSLDEPRTIGAAFEFVEGGTEIQEALAQV
ncbi:MAG: SDR family oxidoreductase [Phycisphaerales bacterium]